MPEMIEAIALAGVAALIMVFVIVSLLGDGWS